MKVFEYDNKELKQQRRAIDVESMIDDMEALEKYQGSTQRKIYEHWYVIKQELLKALTAPKPQEEKKE